MRPIGMLAILSAALLATSGCAHRAPPDKLETSSDRGGLDGRRVRLIFPARTAGDTRHAVTIRVFRSEYPDVWGTITREEAEAGGIWVELPDAPRGGSERFDLREADSVEILANPAWAYAGGVVATSCFVVVGALIMCAATPASANLGR